MQQTEIVPPTPERVAKGDLNRRVYDYLLERSAINEEQHATCAEYEKLYYLSRRPVFKSCLDVKIGAVLSPGDDFIANPLHYKNLWDTVNHELSERDRALLWHVVIEGMKPTEAAFHAGTNYRTATRDFRCALDDLAKVMEGMHART